MKKEYLIIGGILLFIIILYLFSNKKDDTHLILIGGNVSIYENSIFNDPGYEIINSRNDISGYYVNVSNDVNTNIVGTYTIKYDLYNSKNEIIDSKERTVVINSYPIDDIRLTLIGEGVEYYFVGTYEDKGVSAILNRENISNLVQVENNVETNIPGTYEVIYTVTKNNKTKSIKREVHIVELDVTNAIDYKNKKINLLVNNTGFSYMMLPGNIKEISKVVVFGYKEIGNYIFDIYLNSGSHKEYIISIDLIDDDSPIGSCEATFTGNNMLDVVVNVTDASGIKKYIYNGKDYFQNNFQINNTYGKIIVEVYDNMDNKTSITCNKKYSYGFKNVKTSNKYFECHTDVNKANEELLNIVQSYGERSRSAVAAAAHYLASYKYNVAYQWAGKYMKKGLDPSWGCTEHTSLSSSGKLVCTNVVNELAQTCEAGLDCTGFTSWAFYQAGFDANIIAGSNQSRANWGNFSAARHNYEFNSSNLNMANQIKPGDLVWVQSNNTGHVGLVIGVSSDTIEVAHEVGGIKISILKKSNGNCTNGQRSFSNFVLFDDFYNMYGSNT